MRLSKDAIERKIVFLLFFLLFGGYYCIHLFTSQNNGIFPSAAFNKLSRVVILIFVIKLWMSDKKWKVTKGLQLFILFCTAYLLRIIYEIFAGHVYHINTGNFLLYFLSFVVIPFLCLINLNYQNSKIVLIEKAIKVSCLIFGLLVIYYFKDLFAENVGRISSVVTRDNEDYISPLSLASIGSIGMLLSLRELIASKNQTVVRVISNIVIILICAVPFFLGSSRGAFLALLVTLFVILFMNLSGNKLSMIITISCLLFFSLSVSTYLGSNLFDRVASMESDYASGSNSAIRVDIWKASFYQFLSNPLFGNSLASDFKGYKPHNIFLEVLVATGIIGFVPFVYLIYITIRKSFFLLKINASSSYMSLVFIFTLIVGNFSGSIYSASILFVSMAFILGINTYNR